MVNFHPPLALLLANLIGCGTGAIAQETIFESNFENQRAYDYSYAFAGFGVAGEDGDKSCNDKVKVTNGISETAGKPDQCATATLDATKLEVPENKSYEYVGWAFGTAIDLEQPWEVKDFSGYSLSFDAKVSGTKSLASSKIFVNFVVPDDAVAKDEDEFEDIALQLTRGDEQKGGLLTLTNEYKTFTFKLQDDMFVSQGEAANLDKHSVKRIAIALQAQGTASDIGQDADNVLYVDNLRLVKNQRE